MTREAPADARTSADLLTRLNGVADCALTLHLLVADLPEAEAYALSAQVDRILMSIGRRIARTLVEAGDET